MFIVYKPHIHRLNGEEVRKVLDCIEEGDILLRSFVGYLSGMCTGGDWGHAALYVGSNNVIHALGDGIVVEDILTFCRTDSLAILRTNVDKSVKLKATGIARSLIGMPYDYDFLSSNKKYYCSEVISVCYEGIFYDDYETYMKRLVITPNGIYGSKRVSLIYEYRG